MENNKKKVPIILADGQIINTQMDCHELNFIKMKLPCVFGAGEFLGA